MDQAFEQTPFVGWNWLLLQGVFYLKRIISHLAMQTRRSSTFLSLWVFVKLFILALEKETRDMLELSVGTLFVLIR
jgi:hypothetical protein